MQQMEENRHIPKETAFVSVFTGNINERAFLPSGFNSKKCRAGAADRSHAHPVPMKAKVLVESDRKALHRVASRRTFLSLALATTLHAIAPQVSKAAASNMSSAYDIAVNKSASPMKLSDYKGKVTLFVNVATYCALTPQYEGLVSLHDTFQPQGFEIIASPCDQFGHQEPGSNEDICKFAKEQFGAKFLLLDKLNVNDGPGGVAPLYKFLRDTSLEGTGQRVSWNFEKFLVGTDGKVLRRYKPGILPEQIRGDVEWAVKHPAADLPPKKKPSLGVE